MRPFRSNLQGCVAQQMVTKMSANVEQAGFFDEAQDASSGAVVRPLAVRMRPQNLSEMIGQDFLATRFIK